MIIKIILKITIRITSVGGGGCLPVLVAAGAVAVAIVEFVSSVTVVNSLTLEPEP